MRQKRISFYVFRCPFELISYYGRLIDLLPGSYSSVITTPFNGENKYRITEDSNFGKGVPFAAFQIDDTRVVEFVITQYQVSANFKFSFFSNDIEQV